MIGYRIETPEQDDKIEIFDTNIGMYVPIEEFRKDAPLNFKSDIEDDGRLVVS